MTYRFVFRRTDNGELLSVESYAMFPAARALGFDVPHRGPLPAVIQPWECWEGDQRIWHYEADECVPG